MTLAQKKWSPSVLANIIDTEIRKGLRAFLLGGLISCGLFYQQAQAAGITGDITFTGTVNLNTTSAGTATQVTAWHGLAAGNPQVQDVDGDFATFVTPGDGVTFVHLWSFNSGAIPSFWSVDGFTFDLTSSSIASPRPSNAVTRFQDTVLIRPLACSISPRRIRRRMRNSHFPPPARPCQSR